VAAVYTRAQIVSALNPINVITAVEASFAAYSGGEAVVPPVGELLFDEPPGDCHIKFGYLKSDNTFTVKIATGFWEILRGVFPPAMALSWSLVGTQASCAAYFRTRVGSPTYGPQRQVPSRPSISRRRTSSALGLWVREHRPRCSLTTCVMSQTAAAFASGLVPSNVRARCRFRGSR
jgi:hypothetical protein